MNLLLIITQLIVLSAVFGYINTKFLKLPQTIGLMLMAIIFSLVLLIINYFNPAALQFAKDLINYVNFSEMLFDVMLSFLFFAGAMHTDYRLVKKNRRSIILFAFVGCFVIYFLNRIAIVLCIEMDQSSC